MQFLADALRFQRIFAQIQGSEQMQRTPHQLIVGECRAPTGDALVGEDRDEGMDAVIRLDLVRPPAHRCAAAQTGRVDFRKSQCAAPTTVYSDACYGAIFAQV